MPAIENGILSWDIVSGAGGPRRPSLEDVGGAVIEDETPLPDKASMLYADLCNQLQLQIAAFAKIVDSFGISVRISAGTPAVYKATGPGAAAVTGAITVTDNGAGDTSLTWASDLLPPMVLEPMGAINSTSARMISVAVITNGVRVYTFDAAGSAADADFTVKIC